MKNNIHFYRVYYSKLSGVLLGLSLFILLLASACVIKLFFKEEAKYYASSLNGILTPLEPIKLEVNTS